MLRVSWAAGSRQANPPLWFLWAKRGMKEIQILSIVRRTERKKTIVITNDDSEGATRVVCGPAFESILLGVSFASDLADILNLAR